MSASPSGISTNVFISYSRTDSERVDRLEAELIGYGFHTWVDRSHLEGGQPWADQIERAIQGCDAVVVALSPDAAASSWVKSELLYAQQYQKPLIPAVVRPVDKIPLLLVSIQYIDLSTDNQQGIQQLRQRLLAIKPHHTAPQLAPPSGEAILRRITASAQAHVEDPTTILVDLPAPAPAPALNDLFMQGMAAWGHGDLDTAEAILRQVVERDPQFGNGVATQQLAEAQRQLLPIQLQRLRARAIDAERRSSWGEAISAWQAIMERTQPGRFTVPSVEDDRYSEATRCLAIDQQNLNAAWIYDNLRKLAASGDVGAMPQMWQLLQQQAPYYGDPDHLQQHLPAGTLLTTLESVEGAAANRLSSHGWAPTWVPRGNWLFNNYSEYSDSEKRDIHQIRVWNASTGRLIATYQGFFADWSHDGQLLATMDGYNEWIIQIWEIATGRMVATFPGNNPSWAPDGQRIAYQRNGIQIWDLAVGKQVASYQDNDRISRTSSSMGMAWSPDGHRLLIFKQGELLGGDAATLMSVLDVSAGKWLPSVVIPPNKDRQSIDVGQVMWTSDGQQVVSIESIHKLGISKGVYNYFDETKIYVRDITDIGLSLSHQIDLGIARMGRNSGWYVSILVSDSHQLAINITGNDGRYFVQVWDTRTARQVGTLPGHLSGWSSDGQMFATYNPVNTIQVWDTATGRSVANYQGRDAAWSPDTQRLVLSINTSVDTPNFVSIASDLYPGAPDPTHQSYQREQVAVVQVWDIAAGRQIAAIPGESLGWAPDGQRLLILQDDKANIYRA